MVSLALLAAAAVAALVWALHRRRRRRAPPHYVPYRQAVASGALVVDCTHPSLPTLTHHKAHRNPPAALVAPADTSTDLALNALAAAAAGADLSVWLGRRAFASNHFDADALFPCFALANPAAALRHAPLLRAAAELSDFRSGLAAMGADGCAPGAPPPAALALAAWINSVERRHFTMPYEDRDSSDEKFAYFLRELPRFLRDPRARRAEWAAEAEAVLNDWRALRAMPRADAPRLHADVGLAVVRAPRPGHCEFSCALGQSKQKTS
jgi:hypothetical protein